MFAKLTLTRRSQSESFAILRWPICLKYKITILPKKLFRSTRKESMLGCGTCRNATTTHRLSNQIRGGYPTPPCLCLASLLHCQCRPSKDAFQYSWPVIANLTKNAHPQQCEFVSLKPLDNQFVHFVPVATNRTGNECVLMVIIR